MSSCTVPHWFVGSHLDGILLRSKVACLPDNLLEQLPERRPVMLWKYVEVQRAEKRLSVEDECGKSSCDRWEEFGSHAKCDTLARGSSDKTTVHAEHETSLLPQELVKGSNHLLDQQCHTVTMQLLRDVPRLINVMLVDVFHLQFVISQPQCKRMLLKPFTAQLFFFQLQLCKQACK